jgi:hypothetical protein
MATIIDAETEDNNVKLQAATQYLMAIYHDPNFQENTANNFINSLTPICENETLEKKFRSDACTKLSGLHGMMAQKLKMNGISNGVKAYQYLTKAISLDPNNKDAINGHALAVIGIYDQGYLIRKLAESKLGISGSVEALKAKSNLERLNLTGTFIYKKILDLI